MISAKFFIRVIRGQDFTFQLKSFIMFKKAKVKIGKEKKS
jgi:hypothetical protein